MSRCSASRGHQVVTISELVPSSVEQAQLAKPLSLYRLKQVLARIPVSKSSWFDGVKSGRYPRGYHLGPRTTVWRSDDIDRVIQGLGVTAEGVQHD